ncbi:hypothetical protein [Nostoc sp. UIC 10630]|uniref:hypothetical protein n=1 Tax=Nostoc sp. UIC 10630 TaxID=2100146 RepID=UPI0013D8543E|nr:hypothetical protein [Nostoc sp. UIC 10630]NEU80279.1 hypothetical protein [Nostoc sp. UIC 10630]
MKTLTASSAMLPQEVVEKNKVPIFILQRRNYLIRQDIPKNNASSSIDYYVVFLTCIESG